MLVAMHKALLECLAERGITKPLLIGIHTGGVWVGERLHDALGLDEPLGKLDITFYRDDFSRIGVHPKVRSSDLPVSVDDRDIVLIDDVIETGRTVRAGLSVLFDYGRPASVLLAVLAERDGRELPIQPDVVGLKLTPGPGYTIKLTGPQPLELLRQRMPTGRADKPAGDAAS